MAVRMLVPPALSERQCPATSLPGRHQIVQRSVFGRLHDDFVVGIRERIAHKCVKVATCLPVKPSSA